VRSVSSFANIYLHKEFVDFRKSINGLAVIVEGGMRLNLKEPSLFVFCNKPRTHLKILYFDHSGFALWLKRLENSKFPWPKDIHTNVVDISSDNLELMLTGVNIWSRFKEVHFENII
jgi:transposase